MRRSATAVMVLAVSVLTALGACGGGDDDSPIHIDSITPSSGTPSPSEVASSLPTATPLADWTSSYDAYEGEPWPQGIIENGQAPASSSDFRGVNVWQNDTPTEHIQVFAGARGQDHSQGVLWILIHDYLTLDVVPNGGWYDSPVREGALRITDAREDRLLTVVTEEGTELTFDMTTRTFGLSNSSEPPTCGDGFADVRATVEQRYGELRNCGFFDGDWIITTLGIPDANGVRSGGILAILPCESGDAACLDSETDAPDSDWQFIPPPRDGGVTIVGHPLPNYILVVNGGRTWSFNTQSHEFGVPTELPIAYDQ